MKILHIIPSLHIGGTEKILFEICSSDELSQNEFKHHILVLKEGGFTEERFKTHGATRAIPIENLHAKEGFLKGLLEMKLLIRKIRTKIEAIRPDIVHTWLTRANIAGRQAVKGMGVKVISSIRVAEGEKFYHITAERETSNLADVFTVNSPSLKRFVIQNIGIPERKLTLIPNGVNMNKVTSKQDANSLKQEYPFLNDYAIGTVCRLHKQKGVDIFLKAAQEVLRCKPYVKFLVAGDGPERKNLENLSRKLGINRSVYFCGWVNQSFEFISLLKIFVLASRWEGCSNAVLEAMSISTPEDRTPVVATEIGGIRDLIDNGKEGVLVKPEDPKALAKAILDLMDDKDRVNSLPLNALYKVQREFSLEKMVRAYKKLYLDLCQNPIKI